MFKGDYYGRTMASFKAASCLMSFQTSPSLTSVDALDRVKTRLKEFLDLELLTSIPINSEVNMVIMSTPASSLNTTLTANIKVYGKESLVTINLEGAAPLNTSGVEGSYNFVAGSDLKAINNNSMDRLRKCLKKDLETQVEKIPVIKRASQVPLYFESSDDRFFEYDFDQVVFDKESEYQRVCIYHSPTLGNALFLDDLQNLAESDLNYTQGLMNYGKNDFTDKDILILGGGDGGLLHELVKENPRFVTMVDIDQVVIDACRVHLRGACGSTLDTLRTDRYHVIVGDCIKFMEEAIASGRQFDYVFNDLTDIPLSPEESEVGRDLWGFVRNILNLALKCTKKDGKYLNHVSYSSILLYFT